MASLVKNGSNYGLIWSDSERAPRQVRESLKTDSRPRALAKKKQLEWEYVNGDHDPWKRKWYEREVSVSQMVEDLIEEFISYKVNLRGEGAWSDSVASREKLVLRLFARILPDIEIDQLTEHHLESFYYRESVSSDHTRHGDYISINTFLNWCIENDYIKKKPHFRPAKPQTKLPKYITAKQLSRLIGKAINQFEHRLVNKHKFAPLSEADTPAWIVLGWMILAGTGMRPGELSRLRVHDIEYDSIIIGQSFTTKVKKERRVPLLFEARQACEILTDPAFRKLDPHMSSTTLLLGRQPDHASRIMSDKFTSAWKASFPDRPKRTLYNLKDFFAVRFLSDESVASPSGMKLNDLKEILGHASLETTQKYLKAIPYGTRIEGTIWDYPPNMIVSQ